METIVTLELMTCGNCGVAFAMPDYLLVERRKDGQNFYCPNGHARCYRDTEAKREKKRADALEQSLKYAHASAQAYRDQADASERRRAAAVGQVTKIKKRVANGVCPCCNRSFVDLHRHMAGQHPDYVAENPNGS